MPTSPPDNIVHVRTVPLAGRVERSGSQLVAIFDQTSWHASGADLPDLARDIKRSIRSYIRTHSSLGSLDEELAKFGLDFIPDVVAFDVKLSYREEEEDEEPWRLEKHLEFQISENG